MHNKSIYKRHKRVNKNGEVKCYSYRAISRDNFFWRKSYKRGMWDVCYISPANKCWLSELQDVYHDNWLSESDFVSRRELNWLKDRIKISGDKIPLEELREIW